MCEKKLVLVAEHSYQHKHRKFIETLFIEGCVLLCITGSHSENWLTAAEKIANNFNASQLRIFSDPKKSSEQMIDYANRFNIEAEPDVDADIIYI